MFTGEGVSWFEFQIDSTVKSARPGSPNALEKWRQDGENRHRRAIARTSDGYPLGEFKRCPKAKPAVLAVDDWAGLVPLSRA
jgi:hypothetical protein